MMGIDPSSSSPNDNSGTLFVRSRERTRFIGQSASAQFFQEVSICDKFD